MTTRPNPSEGYRSIRKGRRKAKKKSYVHFDIQLGAQNEIKTLVLHNSLPVTDFGLWNCTQLLIINATHTMAWAAASPFFFQFVISFVCKWEDEEEDVFVHKRLASMITVVASLQLIVA
jgi:hypothetical protein